VERIVPKKKLQRIQVEDPDNCFVHFHCPKCGKEFYERGAMLKSGKPIPCRNCSYTWKFHGNEAQKLIGEAIETARKSMKRFGWKLEN
jgi:predicted RNA-binding Zn-ribbon protein involved in translation (DUF1610 family)